MDKFSLAGAIYSGEPEILTRRNILYVPNVRGGADHAFGLYDETGRQLLGSALFHQYPPKIKSQPVVTALAASSFRPSLQAAIYGGSIGDHFGHFITECFNTLWYYILYGQPDDTIVFHSNLSVDEIYSRPYMADLLRFAGVRREQIVIPVCPTVIRNLIIPGQAFSEDGFGYEVYAKACQKVGLMALREADSVPTGPLYLSRQGLGWGTTKLTNEEALISEFAKLNVPTISPEQYNVATQIALMCQPLIGLVGSAFHTSIFVDRFRAVLFWPSREHKRSFRIMDALHDSHVDYVARADMDYVPDVPDCYVAFKISNPAQMARDLLDRMDRPTEKLPQDSLLRVSPQSFEAKTLYTSDYEPVVVDMASECLFVRNPGKQDAPVLAIGVGTHIFLVADHGEAPVLGLADASEEPCPVLVFERVTRGHIVALRRLPSGLYVKGPPSVTGLGLHGDGTVVQGWESFILGTARVDAVSGRLERVLAGLRLFAEQGDMDAAIRISPLLEPALKKVAHHMRAQGRTA